MNLAEYDSNRQLADTRSGPVGYSDVGTGRPALFVHGLEGSSRNWTDLMDLLRPDLACEAVDLPGFCDSPPRPDGRYSIAALADTVAALIRQRGRGAVHLAGNSLGGAVCLKVAATRPELVRTLTLISPALPDLSPAACGARLAELFPALFGAPPLDALIFSATVSLFIAIGLIACFIPAARATRIDPMNALRTE